MPTYRFQDVSHTERRRIPCGGGCGKKLTRSRTFTNTINPFNKNADGEVKKYSEVYADVKAEGEKWEPTGMCPACTERIEGPKPVPPREIYIKAPPFNGYVVEANDVAEAREKLVAKLRREIAGIEARIASADEWRYSCYPHEKCKHGAAPCFPEMATADAGSVA